MATNTLLTPLQITREASRVLHGELSFLGNVNRQYDPQFANEGAKIGNLLNIRMPAKYTVRTSATYAAQNYIERSTPLYCSSQIGVDVSFTTADLTLSLDDFSERTLKPAMTQLAGYMEGVCLTEAVNLTSEFVGTTNLAMTYKEVQTMRAYLTDTLAPAGDRTLCLAPVDASEFMDATKAIFVPQRTLEEQFKEGMLGRTGKFDVYESTYVPSHTNGTFAGSALTTGANGTTTTVNAWASQTTLSVTAATSATTLAAGDIITLSGCYEVHPETKTAYARLKRFVVQTAITLTTLANNYAVVVKPALIWGVGNAFQNAVIPGASSSGLTVSLVLTAGATYQQSLAFHKDAFVFATADLIDVGSLGAWGARVVQDGISMRLARQYVASSDEVITRFDIMYGFGGLNRQHSVRAMHV